MDNRKVLLVKLSHGKLGIENSNLLGSFVLSKLHQIALSRQNTANRPFFGIYIDEFHNFVVPSMESILSGIRKYNIGLCLSHQEFRQLQSRSQEVAASVLSNCYTRICFRLGDTDAEKFAGGFSFFDAKSLQNLGVGEGIGRIERSAYDFNLKIARLPKVERAVAEQRKSLIISNSRERYGTQSNEIEANLVPLQSKILLSGEATKSEVEEPKKQKSKAGVEKQLIETVSEETTEHRYLQTIIKRIGESGGFVSTLEKPVFGGIGKVDVALENESYKIACEIAITNTVEYELQNIQKCLVSGFDKVIVISSDAKHLGNIRKKAESVISTNQLAKVLFLEPENFHLFLDSLKMQSDIPKTNKTKVKGYKVNARFKQSSEADIKTRKQTVSEIVSNLIKRKGKK